MALPPPPGAFGLSPAQTGLWFAQLLQPDLPMTVALYLDLRGPLNIALLDRASAQAGFELGSGALRLGQRDGQPYQYVDAALDRTLQVVDVRAEADPQQAAQAWMARDHQAPLDIYGDGLTLSVLFQLGPDRHLLYLRGHHLAVDGVGAVNLLQRAADIYNGVPGPARPAQLAVAVAAARAYRDSPRFAADAQYWRDQLTGARHTTSLALRQAAPSSCPHRAESVMPPALMDGLTRASQRHNASLAELLIAATGAYFARMTSTEDVFVALPVAARTSAVLRRAAGTFTNTLPLRLHAPAGQPAAEFVAATRRTVVAALRHQLYRHEDMRAASDVGARGIFGPLVNMVLSAPPIRLGTAAGQVRLVTAGPVEDLLINFYRAGPGAPLNVSLHANPRAYSPQEAQHYQRGFAAYLGEFARAPAGLPLHRIAAPPTVAAPPVKHADTRTLPELFAAPRQATTALPGAARSLSSAELGAETARWARMLWTCGVGPEDFVAVVIARSVESVAAIRAVAQAGAAFVPVDPAQPPARVAALLGQANVRVGLTVSSHRPGLPDDIDWILLDRSPLLPDSYPAAAGESRLAPHPDNPAYLIYTSGSTGTPKGVVVTHRGLGPLTTYIRQHYDAGPDSVVLHAHSPSFDAALLELLTAAGGSGLVVAPPGVSAGPALRALLTTHKVTHFLTTPAVLATLRPEELPTLRTVVVGGEPCPERLAETWAAHTAFFNSYGLTETTVMVSQTRPLDPGQPLTIGTPLPAVTARVLDPLLHEVLPGGRGELYVAGPLLARGYLGQPGETAARFVANPFSTGQRCYRTGDIVRQRPDRQLEFAGRGDNQLSLHGYRIEPAEVAAALEAVPSIRQAVVSLIPGPAGEQLIAHVLPSSATDFDEKDALTNVRGRLPGAMVPTKLVVVEDFPLTPNGKVDRTALPPPPAPAPYRPPATPAERQVAEVIGVALGHSPIGRDDEFFQLGGNSLLAVTVAGQLATLTGAPVTVQWIFTHTTVAELAQAITSALAGADSSATAALGVTLWLRRGGSRPPLFCVHSAVPLSWCYAGLVAYLPDRPVCGLQSPGILGDPTRAATLDSLVAVYADAIMGIQQHGPYNLLGWSFGGQLAHALAVRLRERGAEVNLIMLDSLVFPPGTPDPPLPTMRDLLAHFTDAETAAVVPAGVSADDAAHWLDQRPAGTSGKGLTAAQLNRLYTGYVACTLMSHEYQPAVFDGDLLYFCATTGMTELADAQIWRPFVSGAIIEHPVASDHASLTTPAAIAVIGPLVAQHLAQREARKQPARVGPR